MDFLKCKLFLGVLILFLFGVHSSAQNLVPNPSFETHTIANVNLWSFGAGFSDWKGLSSHLDSPDLYNWAPGSPYFMPKDGNIMARTGVLGGIAGIIPFEMTEYLNVQLTSPMVAGQTYEVSYWVTHFNKSDRGVYYNGVNRYWNADNIVQTHISQAKVLGGGAVWNAVTSITPTHTYSTPFDTSGVWQQVSFTYIATGCEEWLTVGNFNNNASSNWRPEFNAAGAPVLEFIYYDDFVIEPLISISSSTFCYNDPPVNLNSLLSGAVPGVWSGTGVTGNMFDPSFGTQNLIYTIGSAPCTNQYPVTITVNDPSTLPGFSAVGSICSGEPLSPLPTESNNGIKGSWSPSIDNTVTKEYIFTPGLGQCTMEKGKLTIVVNSKVKPIFGGIAPICVGDALSALPILSNNGVTGTWAPMLDNTKTTTYVFTPNVGGCSDTASLKIVVNPVGTKPTFAAVSPICAGDALSALPILSNNGVTGTWAPMLDNTKTTTYVFTPNFLGCSDTASLKLVVNPVGTKPTFAAVSPICFGEGLSALPTTSTNLISGVWSPSIDSATTTTYVFTPNAGQCSDTSSMTIVVNPSLTPTFDSIAVICSGDSLLPLPLISNNGIAGTWSPTLDNTRTTTYAFTADPGQCALNQALSMTVKTVPVASFDYSPIEISILSNEVNFNNTSTGASSYLWDFGDATSSQIINPDHLYDLIPGDYEVVLVAFNEGCTDTTRSIIEINDVLIEYTPNSFTPNGDGINDVFTPVFSKNIKPKNYVLTIFNRWGEIIFSTENYKNGWDGSYNGTLVQQDTYVWKLTYRDDSNGTDNDEVGKVTVIR